MLYEVSYISQVEEYHYSDNLRAIADLYTQIGTVLDSLSNPDIIQLLSGYVESMLDQIRLLYKAVSYTHLDVYKRQSYGIRAQSAVMKSLVVTARSARV